MTFLKGLLLLLLCSMLLTTPACASMGDGPPLTVSKVDQLFGVYLAYDLTDHTQVDKEVALTQALTVLGVDMAAVDAIAPSATGLILAAKVVDGNEDLVPYQDLIAKLWTLAIYGDGSAPPDPGGDLPVPYQPTSLGTTPARCAWPATS